MAIATATPSALASLLGLPQWPLPTRTSRQSILRHHVCRLPTSPPQPLIGRRLHVKCLLEFNDAFRAAITPILPLISHTSVVITEHCFVARSLFAAFDQKTLAGHAIIVITRLRHLRSRSHVG